MVGWLRRRGTGSFVNSGAPVEAVRCALEVQDATRANGGADLLLRMGINLGDIMAESDGDITATG